MGIEKLLALVEKSCQDPRSVIPLTALSHEIHEIICSEQASEYRINGCYKELKLLVNEIKSLSRRRLNDKVYIIDLTQYKLTELDLRQRLKLLVENELSR